PLYSGKCTLLRYFLRRDARVEGMGQDGYPGSRDGELCSVLQRGQSWRKGAGYLYGFRFHGDRRGDVHGGPSEQLYQYDEGGSGDSLLLRKCPEGLYENRRNAYHSSKRRDPRTRYLSSIKKEKREEKQT